jgi:hypothetical protein
LAAPRDPASPWRRPQKSAARAENSRPTSWLPTPSERAGAALQAQIARLAAPGDARVAYGDNVSTIIGAAEDITKLLTLPEVWAVEIFVTNDAMTWRVGFRHDELYLAGDACPPRGSA